MDRESQLAEGRLGLFAGLWGVWWLGACFGLLKACLWGFSGDFRWGSKRKLVGEKNSKILGEIVGNSRLERCHGCGGEKKQENSRWRDRNKLVGKKT